MLMRTKGYEIKGETFGEDTRKYISFRPMHQKNFVRGSARSLGKEYTKERIKERIEQKQERKVIIPKRDYSSRKLVDTSDEKFKAYQDEIFRVYKELGIGGPNWPHTFYYGRDRMMKLYEQGMRFPMSLSNSSRTMKAKREGATLVNPHSRSGVDSNDPVFVKILTDSIYAYRDLRDYEFIKKSLSFVMGPDLG